MTNKPPVQPWPRGTWWNREQSHRHMFSLVLRPSFPRSTIFRSWKCWRSRKAGFCLIFRQREQQEEQTVKLYTNYFIESSFTTSKTAEIRIKETNFKIVSGCQQYIRPWRYGYRGCGQKWKLAPPSFLVMFFSAFCFAALFAELNELWRSEV